MIAIQTSARNGRVVGAVLVVPSDEIMLITNSGVLVRTRVSEIREMGRATQGVTLMNVDDDSTLSGVRRVVETDVDALLDDGEPDAPAEAQGQADLPGRDARGEAASDEDAGRGAEGGE